jgi:hypothetical protein
MKSAMKLAGVLLAAMALLGCAGLANNNPKPSTTVMPPETSPADQQTGGASSAGRTSQGSRSTNGPISRQLPSPRQISPGDGARLDNYPRYTTLTWSGISGAAVYDVEVQCLGCGAPGVWVTWPSANTTTKATEHSFTWTADIPGRWRVTAIAADTSRGQPSGWWRFTYTTGLASYAGTWVSSQPDTRSIPQLTLTPLSGTRATLQIWGACTPTWCDWGTTTASKAMDGTLRAFYDQGFSTNDVRINQSGTQLVVRIHTHFTDNSGRADYDSTEIMNRKSS